MTKKLRFFAGPNGSGKTALIKKISEYFEIGYLINADNIEAELKDKGYIDCAEYFPHLNLLYPAFEAVNRAFIIDSSGNAQNVILEKVGKEVIINPDIIPEWVDEYLLNKLR